MRMLSVLFILLSINVARADILFVDFNNNPGEIRAAQSAAEKRGEKLIVIGHLPEADRKLNEDFDRQSKALTIELTKLNIKASGGEDLGVDSGREAREVIEKQLDNIEKKRPPKYRLDKFQSDVTQLQASGKKISSIVISGHDGNGAFFGTNGEIGAEQIAQAFKANPEIASGIRSIVLAGCYTGTPGALEVHWKKIVPNATLVAGYDESAPLGSTTQGWSYISEVLGKEKALNTAADEKTVKNVFDKLRNIQGLNAAICVNDNLVNRDGVRSLDSLKNTCEVILADYAGRHKDEARVNCFLQASVGCENPPADTANGELRQIYNRAQSQAHCMGHQNQSMFSLDTLIRLIHFKNIAQNISNNYRAVLEEYDRILKRLGLGDMSLGDISQLSRAEIIKRLNDAELALGKLQHDPALLTGPNGAAALRADDIRHQLKNTLKVITKKCVPFGWVEAGASETSSCVKTGLTEEMSKSELPYTYRGAIQDKSYESASGDAAKRIEYYQKERTRLLSTGTAETRAPFIEQIDSLISAGATDLHIDRQNQPSDQQRDEAESPPSPSPLGPDGQFPH